MTERIGQNFLRAGDVLVNYDFLDLLEGTGYIIVYGHSDEADNKTLIRNTIESTDVYSQAKGTSASVENNFDYEFKQHQYVKGKLYVSITIYCDGASSNAADNDTTIEIFHYDGSTETSIGTQQSLATLTNPAGDAGDSARHTCSFDIDKKFKKGEYLRVEVITSVTSGNANSIANHYHDPANRDLSLTDQHGAAANSNLIVMVPFDLGGKL